MVHIGPRKSPLGRSPAWNPCWIAAIDTILGLSCALAQGGILKAEEPAPKQGPVVAAIETMLTTADGQIRQFAFDGDLHTFFASAGHPRSSDLFSLIFDRPVAVRSITIKTGRPDGRGSLDDGAVETSGDGLNFKHCTNFVNGRGEAGSISGPVVAVRIRPSRDMTHELAIREIAITSEPVVGLFQYPVEFRVDSSEVPELRGWAEKAAKVCERAYPMINFELRGDDFKPPSRISFTVKNNYEGVAYTSGDAIVASARFFKSHPGDFGAIVHETAHVVQHYGNHRNPGWLVEGVADYIRFLKFEPGMIGQIHRNDTHYNGSYRKTASFLNYLTEVYDKQIVLKLNRAMRAGTYHDGLFKELIGKNVHDLDEEWRRTLDP